MYEEFGTIKRRPPSRKSAMADAVERLQANVLRAMRSKRRTGSIGTMVSARGDVPIRPQMSDAEYAALVARGELQSWTMQDEIDLREKVRALRG